MIDTSVNGFEPHANCALCSRIKMLHGNEIDLTTAFTDAMHEATDRIEAAHVYQAQRDANRRELHRLMELHAR
jgi:hypothetical protein